MIRKRLKSAAAIFAAAATLASVAGVAVPAAAAPAPGPGSIQFVYFTIKSVNDGRCLRVNGYGADLPVIGGSCATADSWFFTEKSTENGTSYWIRNTDSGGQDPCILMRNFGSAAYKGVQYPCLNYADQYWYLDNQGYPPGNRFKIRNKAHGSCMVLRSWQTQVEGSACADFSDQIWEIIGVI